MANKLSLHIGPYLVHVDGMHVTFIVYRGRTCGVLCCVLDCGAFCGVILSWHCHANFVYFDAKGAIWHPTDVA